MLFRSNMMVENVKVHSEKNRLETNLIGEEMRAKVNPRDPFVKNENMMVENVKVHSEKNRLATNLIGEEMMANVEKEIHTKKNLRDPSADEMKERRQKIFLRIEENQIKISQKKRKIQEKNFAMKYFIWKKKKKMVQ